MQSRQVVTDIMSELAALAAMLDSGVSVEHEHSQLVVNRVSLHLSKLKKKAELPDFLEHRRNASRLPAPFFTEK